MGLGVPWFSEGAQSRLRTLTPALSRRERGPFGVGGEFGIILSA